MAEPCDSVPHEIPPRWLLAATTVLVAVGTLGGVWGGPALGDHEAIVGQCARDMRLTGDWLVPRFLDTPFIRKPPLPYWLVASVSYLFPNDPHTGLPITPGVARLPSALAAFGTVLLLWRLGSAMFGRRTGLLTAMLAGSSLFFLLYGANVTAEMILTFCCTWAFVHFWFAVTTKDGRRRVLHLLFFYVALGFAMLAKGPAPISMAMIPLIFWWYTERPLRLLASRGTRSARLVVLVSLRGLWPQTKRAFTRLWLVPGLFFFALPFVPWMWAVTAQHPSAWNIWNWQYLQRAQGDYEDTRVRGVLYYVPILAGYVLPWLFMLFEGLAAPWMKRYARVRRGLLYAGLWSGVGILLMSLMSFKKPYYIGPAVPGLILLMAVVAERVVAYRPRSLRWAWGLWGALGLALIVGLVVGALGLRQTLPSAAGRLTLIAVGMALLLLAAGAVYIRGRGGMALGIVAVASIATFHAVWYGCGATLDNVDKVAALAEALEAAEVPPGAPVAWADQRPDARLSFYFNRRSTHLITPDEIVERLVDRTGGKHVLENMVMNRAAQWLERPEPVYLILDRKHYEQWKSPASLHAHLVSALSNGDHPRPDDWVIVSNRASPKSTTP